MFKQSCTRLWNACIDLLCACIDATAALLEAFADWLRGPKKKMPEMDDFSEFDAEKIKTEQSKRQANEVLKTGFKRAA